MNEPQPTREPASPRGLRSWPVGYVIIAALILIALVAAGVVRGLRLTDLQPQPASPISLPFEDRTSPEQMAGRRAQALEHLNSAGWVDQEAGIAHIPIEAAMELVAENGLPVRAAITETANTNAAEDEGDGEAQNEEASAEP